MGINIIESSYRIINKYNQKSKKPKYYGVEDLLYAAEVHVLNIISLHKELNTTGLAQILGVTKGAVSQTVNKLTEKGLAEKHTAQKKNEIIITLTEKGEKVNEFHRNMHIEMYEKIDAVLDNLSPEAICAVEKIIGIIDDSLDKI